MCSQNEQDNGISKRLNGDAPCKEMLLENGRLKVVEVIAIVEEEVDRVTNGVVDGVVDAVVDGVVDAVVDGVVDALVDALVDAVVDAVVDDIVDIDAVVDDGVLDALDNTLVVEVDWAVEETEVVYKVVASAVKMGRAGSVALVLARPMSTAFSCQ